METEKRRLIDANAFLQKLSKMIDYCKTDNKVNALTALFQVGDAVMDCPTVDAVEVVRCKDCKYSHDHEINRNYRCHRHARDGYSQVFDATFTDNDFCSYGERKDNG